MSSPRINREHLTLFKVFNQSLVKIAKTYQDVVLVDVVLPSFFGNKKHLFKEEERAGVLRPQHMESAL